MNTLAALDKSMPQMDWVMQTSAQTFLLHSETWRAIGRSLQKPIGSIDVYSSMK